MNKDCPVVSVVMPVYNAQRFLELAIRSVLEQSFADWELLLVDDASVDDSLSIAARYAELDPRIRLLRNKENIGVAETRNRGIRAARGTWIALLDSDDLWKPEKLEKQLELARDSGAELIYCSYALIDENGVSCCADFLVPEETNVDSLLQRSVISCSTALIRRDLLLEHPFCGEYTHEDLVLWLDLLQAGCRACGCREVLAAYRLSENSRSGNKLKAAAGRWLVFRRHMHLSLLRSSVLFLRYALAATQKYKRS